jgi:hypothetical protein
MRHENGEPTEKEGKKTMEIKMRKYEKDRK